MTKDISIYACQRPEDFHIAKKITQDYTNWLDMDLSFQDFENEMNAFSSIYGKPYGCYIIAKHMGKIAGGVGVRKLEETICEMKRLFVYDTFQGLGIGKLLCFKIIEIAKSLGYHKMRLDTIAKLVKANHLYENIGFKDIPQYRENPDETSRFMELDLLMFS